VEGSLVVSSMLVPVSGKNWSDDAVAEVSVDEMRCVYALSLCSVPHSTLCLAMRRSLAHRRYSLFTPTSGPGAAPLVPLYCTIGVAAWMVSGGFCAVVGDVSSRSV